MDSAAYNPPWWLKNGLVMTLYMALWMGRRWEATLSEPEPEYEETIFTGANQVPLFAWLHRPQHAQGTIIATYGITGTLENQWFLRILGRKAVAQGFAVVLFDWRAHGQTAVLSPTLTSDGLYEGEDFVQIAAQAKARGFPAPFWFAGYSLGGQLALWGVKAAQELTVTESYPAGLQESDIAGAAVICPSLDSNRSLAYLVRHPLGRYLEKAIARELKKLAWRLHELHPGVFDPDAIARANSIRGFDQELVIKNLGFTSVEEYYAASSALPVLPHLRKPTLILYAADDPLFEPSLVPELQAIAQQNPAIHLCLTRYGGHVAYLSQVDSKRSGSGSDQEADPWWAWNQVLAWYQSEAMPKELCSNVDFPRL